jgi:hypothetical protein
MKKITKLFLLPVLFAGSLSLGTTGCSADDVCNSSSSACGEFTACCDEAGTDCWYEYNGKTYDCNGSDCSSAAQELAEDMCDFKSEAELIAFKQTLIDAIQCGCK